MLYKKLNVFRIEVSKIIMQLKKCNEFFQHVEPIAKV